MAGGQGTEAPVTTLVPERRKGNLPAEVTSFTGRRRELSQVRDALERYRLVPLRGVGGSGRPGWRCIWPPICNGRSPTECAVRLRAMSIEQIVTRLDDRF